MCVHEYRTINRERNAWPAPKSGSGHCNGTGSGRRPWGHATAALTTVGLSGDSHGTHTCRPRRVQSRRQMAAEMVGPLPFPPSGPGDNERCRLGRDPKPRRVRGSRRGGGGGPSAGGRGRRKPGTSAPGGTWPRSTPHHNTPPQGTDSANGYVWWFAGHSRRKTKTRVDLMAQKHRTAPRRQKKSSTSGQHLARANFGLTLKRGLFKHDLDSTQSRGEKQIRSCCWAFKFSCGQSGTVTEFKKL